MNKNEMISNLKRMCEDIKSSMRVPDYYPEYIEYGYYGDDIYNMFRKEIGCTLVSLDWVSILAEKIIKPVNGRCLEIMAGTGMLSAALRECGVQSIATDNMSFINDKSKNWDKEFTYVENRDAINAIETYGKHSDFLIISWPDPDDIAYRCLELYRDINPYGHLIYIGEDIDGKCANNDFFLEMYKIARYSEEEIVSDSIMYKILKHFKTFANNNDTIYIV